MQSGSLATRHALGLVELERTARDMDSDSLRYAILMVRALAKEHEGRWHEAVPLRREIVAMSASFGSPGLTLSQRSNLVRAMFSSGDRDGAVALASAILVEAERLGRADVARECRELLADAG